MSLQELTAVAVVLGLAGVAGAQTIDPYYECAYRFVDLGTPPDVPAALGGLVIKADDPDTLLIGGSANGAAAKIYAVPLIRDAEDQIVGFGAASVMFAEAPNIDGGLFYGPDGVLMFSRYSSNQLGQIKPGSSVMDKSVALTPLGFSSSVGAMAMVPAGFQGEGRLKVFPYNSSRWHDAELLPDGSGTFDVSGPLSDILLSGGPEGIVYVEAGASLFPNESVLISEYSNGRIASYQVDSNGDPIANTRRDFLTGLSGAEGGARDPLTGDFLFSTFGGGNRVLVVRGFDPECEANYNADCVVNTQDVLAFLNDWVIGDPKADFNGDGSVNTLDVLSFLNRWVAGC
ncbi:MAG: hypothetical protein HND58_19090 [Planctomycetota bacterium]|nr:MAG: hypothetical protein HND58_19090 [Planctomycetota bacterium]